MNDSPITDDRPGDSAMTDPHENRRQVLYWRLLARTFDPEEQPSLEVSSVAIVDDLGLPTALLDPGVSIDNLVQRFPELGDELENLMPSGPDGGDGGDGDDPEQRVRRAALISKLLLNTLCTGSGSVSATQLADWQKDAEWLKRALAWGPGGSSPQIEGALGCGAPGGSSSQSGQGPGGEPGGSSAQGGYGPGGQPGESSSQMGGGGGRGPSLGGGGGRGPSELDGILSGVEGDLVKRMRLREVLADPRLAARLTPSMSLIEQLLRDKANLSGVALANAKSLIRRYVDEVAEVLRTQVQQTSAGTIDRSVPPKRVFRNLDLDRTIWKNLTNWSPEDERLYVDRLFYRHTAKRTTPARMIVVVDQSGSMVDSMVNCTILASIFAGLPKVNVDLIAYDTRALDLTPWVNDPFEVLLRTNLGGGNDGPVAMAMARPKISDPRNTVMVWISDFYEFDRSQPLFDGIEAVHRSGVKFIPVGSVNSSGLGIVNPWFRQRFKSLGTPVISGHIGKLVFELKNFIA